MPRFLRSRAPIATGVALWLTVAIGCASAGKTNARGSCELHPRDSTYSAGRPVYRDCAVDRQATLTNANLHPDWTPPTTGRNTCYSVELEFVVNETGRIERETATVLRSNDRSFADAWLTTLGEWRFEPAMRAGVRVRQIATAKRSAQTRVVVVSGPVGAGRPPSGTPRPPNC